MPEQIIMHVSTQFNIELHDLANKIMEMGGITEKQMKYILESMDSIDEKLLDEVIRLEVETDLMEMQIDKDLATIIAKRQPTARDLRFIIAVSRSAVNLERIGDQFAKLAYNAKKIAEFPYNNSMSIKDLQPIAEMTSGVLSRCLNAFARLDVDDEARVLHDTHHIDIEFDRLIKQLVNSMMNDPSSIAIGVELIFMAKAYERIGDHVENVAELVSYIVKGEDLRHSNLVVSE